MSAQRVGLGSLSAAVVLLEITLTRIYAVTQGYHFAFLAVSLGLLGFGASGTALFGVPRLLRLRRTRLLGYSALLFAGTTLASFWAINVIPFDSYRLTLEPMMFLHLALFYLVQVLPFFFAGVAIGGAFALEPGGVGGLYGASLMGSGVGALLALGGFSAWGPAGPIATATTLGAAAGLVLIAQNWGWGFWPAIGAALVAIALSWWLPQKIDLNLSPYKSLPQLLSQKGSSLVETRWDAVSRVDVVRSDALHQAPGLSLTYSGRLPRQSALTIDGDNATMLTEATPQEANFVDYLPTSLPYLLLTQPRVVVVEPGGGLDVLIAQRNGAAQVTALVGTALEAEILRDRFPTGKIDPEADIVAANPRSYIERSGQQVDLIVVSLRNAFQPVIAGAYSLSENHLYTREAFQAYLSRLVPGGFLMATRWVQVPPSEEMRMVATAMEAMQDAGLDDVGANMAAIRSLQTFTVLIKNGRFSETEIGAIRAFARERQFDISFLPGLDPSELNRFFVLQDEVYHKGINTLLDSRQRSDYYRAQTFDVAPVTDDRPFFFHFFRWRQLPDVFGRLGKIWQPFGGAGFLVILMFLGFVLVVSALLILAPLLTAPGRAQACGPPHPPTWQPLAYFSLLGLAFMWIELPLMQRLVLLLDHPTYSFSIVLFTVLVSSGLGAALSPRIGTPRTWILLAPGVLSLLYAFGLLPPVGPVLGLPLPARLAVATLTIAPLGILMGIPFPTGIRILEKSQPRLIPWAWAVNGYASVVGSVLAALIALTWGFSRVMLLASIAYLLVWAVFHFGLRTHGSAAQTARPPGWKTPTARSAPR